MPLYVAKSEETWLPPYPARDVTPRRVASSESDAAYLYPRPAERPLAERVHRGTGEGGVWLGGRPKQKTLLESCVHGPAAAAVSERTSPSARGDAWRRETGAATIHEGDRHRLPANSNGRGDGERRRWYAIVGGKPGESLGGAVVSTPAAAERAMNQIGRKERDEMESLGLPTHRVFASRDAALDWLAVQGLNARGRNAPTEEVKATAARTPWIFDSTPRTAAAAASSSSSRASSRAVVTGRRPGRDAWAAALARDTHNADLRLRGAKLVLHLDPAENLREIPPWRGGGWEPKGRAELSEVTPPGDQRTQTRNGGGRYGQTVSGGGGELSWMPRDLTPRVMRDADLFIPHHLRPTSAPAERVNTHTRTRSARHSPAPSPPEAVTSPLSGTSATHVLRAGRATGKQSEARATGEGERNPTGKQSAKRAAWGGKGSSPPPPSPAASRARQLASRRLAERYPTLSSAAAAQAGGLRGSDDLDDGGYEQTVRSGGDGDSFTFATPKPTVGPQQYWDEYRGEYWEEFD